MNVRGRKEHMKTITEEIKEILEYYELQNTKQRLAEKRRDSFRRTRDNIDNILSQKFYDWLSDNDESLKENNITFSRDEGSISLIFDGFTIGISFSGSSNDKYQDSDATYEGFIKWTLFNLGKTATTGGTAYAYKGLSVNLDYTDDNLYLERQITKKFSQERFKEIFLTSLRNSLLNL